MRENPIIETACDPISIDIFIGGNRAAATEACREFCLEGLCVTISETDFVFTGGMESGVRVGLINYARFPTGGDVLLEKAKRLAVFLIERLHQSSCTVMAPQGSFFLSRRPK